VGPQFHQRSDGFRDSWTIWENLRPPVSRFGYQVLQLVSSLTVLSWCLYQHRSITNLYVTSKERTETQIDASDSRLLMEIISIWASWQLLFGPGAEQLTYGLIAPSVAWALMTSFAEKKNRLWLTITWLILVLFSCGEIETPMIRLHPAFAMLLPLSVISFVVWLIYHESLIRSPMNGTDRA
jgi:hypothetical protein